MKKTRQEQILSIIENNVILTQEDLQNALLDLGYAVNQSTVSRDIKELKLFKSRDKDGNYRYVADLDKYSSGDDEHQKDMFVKSVLSVDYALNNVVITCRSGLASGACVALDHLFHKYMLGSLAGDDTIIVVTKSTENSEELVEKIKSIM